MPQINLGNNDLLVNGVLYGTGVSVTSATITDAMISTTAAIDASKLDHQYMHTFTQVHGSASATERRVIYVAKEAGDIVDFLCGSVVLNVGAATISIRLKKNGTNIDTAATVLDTGNTAFVAESAAGYTSTTYVAGDVFEVDLTATAGGGTLGQGVFCQLIVREAA